MASHLEHQHHDTVRGPGELVGDPVCGMSVDPQTAAHHTDHGGETFWFCSAHCRARFETDPASFVHPAAPPDAPTAAPPAADPTASAGPGGVVEYTCPMHPEVRRPGAGACPICGMALEPVTVTADTGPSPELSDMTRRFWIALVLSIPVVVLEMGTHLYPPCTRWSRRRFRGGPSWCWPPRSWPGRAGRSSSAAGCRSAP